MRRRAVVSAGIVLLLAGCGSSSSSSSRSGAASAGDAQAAARVSLARCLRSHGIDVPDPGAGGTSPSRSEMLQLTSRYSPSQIAAAANACRSSLAEAFPQMALTPAQQAQRRRQALQYVRCMRAHGIDLPDPSSSGLGLGLGRALSTVDQSSPAFKAANRACERLRPARIG